ncbi:hypothetical protein [Maribellus sp. YY47]|uniref:hypothetical protein n=1 Tax=Maribellus sp. YY47 TaxID=2929486 RepID=UPI0020009D41|nr:hypothetical protein [Maribellus sp. YY47]MCK3683653.1 hypothetical protein [Maribellus sp. YY47]
MSKRIGITLIFLSVLYVLNAQQKWNYPAVDKKSYALFLQKDWKHLIAFNDSARQNGIDYFNLQARTGIAWYNLGKYRKSTPWFEKAWKNDQQMEWLQEYLYYSLLFSGRSTEAGRIAKDFTVGLQEKINYRRMQPLRLAFEAGFSFNPDFGQLQASQMHNGAGVGSDYGEGFLLKNYYFGSLDYSHRIAPGLNLNHNFTYLGVNREEQLLWGSNYNFPMDIKQYQYFLSPHFALGKWYFSPSLNLTWGNYDLILGNYDPNTFYTVTRKYSDFIFSTSMWTHWGNISPGAEINLANINNSSFTQASAWMTFYPLSNLRLYLTPRVYFKSDAENSFSYNTFGLSGGFQLGQFHFYGNYLDGEMENFVESGGYVIGNFPGHSTRKFMGSIYFPFAKKYQFVVRYINQDVIEKYQVYRNLTRDNFIEYSYIKQTITAGISWNF